MKALAFALAMLGASGAAQAAPTAAQLSAVGLRTRSDAAAAWDTPWRDATGRATTLRRLAAGRPVVLVFADYGCTALCGPALAIAAARLRESGLSPGHDFTLAVIGLDPASPPQAAQAFGDARLGAATPLAREAALLTGDPPAIAAETMALGFGYIHDPESSQFIHPVAAFVLTPTGRVCAVLSEITLTARALRAAVVAARAGRPTSDFDRLAIACHGALAAFGRFDAPSITGLRVGALATLAGLVGAVGWLLKRDPRSAG